MIITQTISEPIMRQTFSLSYIYNGSYIKNIPSFNKKAPILAPIMAPIYANIYHQCSANVRYPTEITTNSMPIKYDMP